jgi:hypothetical protein
VATDWKSGKRSVEEGLPYEGTLDFTLNNDSKIFSPANTASPLYGSMQQNRKVVIQIQNPTTSVWSNMWVGWLDSFGVDTGRSLTRQAKMLCKQGVYRFNEGEFNVPVITFQDFKTIVKALVEAGSWRSGATAYEGVLGFNMTLNETAYLQDINAAFNLLQEGLNTYGLQGLDWGRNTTTSEALADLFNAENAGMWIDRDGLLNVVNRNFWVNRRVNPDVVLNLDTNVQAGSYTYGDNIINRMEVQYQPPKFNVNQVVWKTKNSVPLTSKKERSIAMVFSLPEGRVKTVQNVQDAVVMTVYTQNLEKFPNAPVVTDTTILGNILSKVYSVGSRYYLSLTNNNPITYYIIAQINGDFVDTGDQIAGVYQDRDSINQTVSVHKKTMSSPIISTTEQAEAVAEFYVSRNAFPVGNFSSISVVDDDTQATFDLIQSLKIGNIVKITEAQTTENGILAAIVEESGMLQGGSFRYTATLSKLDQNGYFQLDIGATEGNNAASDAFPVGIRGATVSKPVGDTAVLELSTDRYDGWIYFIDQPMTVRDFSAADYRINANLVNVNFYRNQRKFFSRLSGSTPHSLAAKTFNLETSSPTFGWNASLGGYPFVACPNPPSIPIIPQEYYTAWVSGEVAHTSKDGSPAYVVVLDELSYRASSFGFYVTAELWDDVSGVRYLGQDNILAHSGTWIRGSDTTAASWQFFTQPFFETGLGDTADVGRNNVNNMAFMLKATNTPTSQILTHGFSLVQCSHLNNMAIDSTKTYKLAVWLKAGANSGIVNYTFEALDANHRVVASTTGNVGQDLTKLEVTVPSGNSYITGRLRKTSANSEGYIDKLLFYDLTLTETSLASYLDVPANTALVYI